MKRSSLTLIGSVLMLLGVILALRGVDFGTEGFAAFAGAAAPWVLSGLGIALVCAGAFGTQQH